MSDVARYLKVAERTVFRMIQRGQIPAVKVGRLWRVQWAWLQDWLASGRSGSRPASAVRDERGLKTLDRRTVETVMRELQTGLRAIYGDRLRGVYLYGSYARRDADPESDLDVLVVLDRIERYSAEVDRTSGLSSELSLKYGVSISKVYLAERDWRERDSPFLANVREEAVAA